MEGILPLWKEKGMTSFDCVFKARKILGIKKIGHAGTLDPEVDGVLPMGVGRGTKILEYMLESDKMYTGELLLGYSTSTEDATGEVIERKRVENDISNQKIDKILRDFEGEIEQTPPMFSAVKVDGKRLYEYAFEGIEIDRPSRMIEIYQIRRTSDIIFNDKDKTARFSFEVSSSKGTYIRTLAVDIGKKLGYPAHMSRLTRTESGSIKEKDTVSLEELEKAVEEGNVSNLLLPIEYGLEIFPRYPINDEIWQQVKNGRVFSLDKFKIDNYPVLFTYNEKAVAIYNHHPSKEGIIKPIKVLRTEW
ncbi:MAG: tRNA pseudouridine(55) synthase TruB [Atopostipes suicloacalis]|nr:tRNA pseudouridine(55) synthase TruB [Atopostipes suicloacalis]MDN6731064.1 tRNA pseudouridine(55) synthase TruB [Atopostipes suicloacalis]